MSRTTPFHFLSSAPLMGAVAASFTLALPADLVDRTSFLLPSLAPLDKMAACLPPGLPSGRVILLAGGFTLGFVARKYMGWLRLWAIKALLGYQDWVNGDSWKTRIWGILLRFLVGSGPHSTFEFQQCLPSQPLPDLDSTLNRWLEVSRFFQTEEEYECTRQAVEEFRHNEGPKAQAHLLKLKKKKESWLEDYWQYAAYLSSRHSLMYNSNFYGVTAVQPSVTTDQLARAAHALHQIVRYEQKLKNHQLEPVMQMDCVPFCMVGYQAFFNSARIPGETVDVVQRFPNNDFAVVLRNNIYFRLDFFHADKAGRQTILSPEEFKIQLQRICDIADAETNPDPPVAALTSQDRPTWAKQRQMLLEFNKDTVDTIEHSMFIIVLDTETPKDPHEFSKITMIGRGPDRWFDKCFTAVFYPEGTHGNCVEHTCIDGMGFLAFTSDAILNSDLYENGDIIRDPLNPPRAMKPPQRLRWNLKGLEPCIDAAIASFHNMESDVEMHMENCQYGKGYMKKCRISPDGFIQMAFQLAYYRMYKEIPKTYEPATNRFFHRGRTETVHPVSQWSIDWVRSMDDAAVGKERRRTLLKNAVKYQNQFRLDATTGKGCDRHLLGLLMASAELGLGRPKIFTDSAWTKDFKLSTSQSPQQVYETYSKDGSLVYELCNGGFGPTSADGYGVNYMIYGDDILLLSIACHKHCEKTNAAKLGAMINEALGDMKTLFTD